MIFLINGTAAPTGYTFLGSFTEDVTEPGVKKAQTVQFNIYRKDS